MRIAVRDEATHQWLTSLATPTWGSFKLFDTTVTDVSADTGSTYVHWQASVALPAPNQPCTSTYFRLDVRAVDTTGAVETSRPWEPVSVYVPCLPT